MVSTQNNRQPNKRLFCQLDQSVADFMIGLSNRKAQAQSRTDMVDPGISSDNMIGPIQVNSPQVNIVVRTGGVVY